MDFLKVQYENQARSLNSTSNVVQVEGIALFLFIPIKENNSACLTNSYRENSLEQDRIETLCARANFALSNKFKFSAQVAQERVSEAQRIAEFVDHVKNEPCKCPKPAGFVYHAMRGPCKHPKPKNPFTGHVAHWKFTWPQSLQRTKYNLQ